MEDDLQSMSVRLKTELSLPTHYITYFLKLKKNHFYIHNHVRFGEINEVVTNKDVK